MANLDPGGRTGRMASLSEGLLRTSVGAGLRYPNLIGGLHRRWRTEAILSSKLTLTCAGAGPGWI